MVRRRGSFRSAVTSTITLLVILSFTNPSVMAASRSLNPTASFERGRRDLPQVALTFDGGGDAGESGRILDVLEQRGAPVTFFLTGDYIRHNPELVRRIAAAGHEVGNHTWSHPHLTTWNRLHRHDTLPGVDRTFIQTELDRTALLFEAVTGRPMAAVWRAPFGEVNDDLLRWADAAGWSHVGWTRNDNGGPHTLDSLDWVAECSSSKYLTSQQIISRILSFGIGGTGLNGGIVLMHLSTSRKDQGVTRLAELIDSLREHGYSLVTVTELQQNTSPPPSPVALSRPHE